MKKLVSLVLAVCMAVGLAGCGAASGSSSSAASSASQASSSQSEAVSSAAPSEPAAEKTDFVIAGMKGPTTMGMVKLMSDAEAGTTRHNYQVDMYATAQEILPLMVKGEIDVAMLPANVAGNLYNQTEGKVQVAAINTLGVLYVVETGETLAVDCPAGMSGFWPYRCLPGNQLLLSQQDGSYQVVTETDYLAGVFTGTTIPAL